MIDQINELLKWLADNAKSKNIVAINQALNKLSILAVTVGEGVSEAYALANELEDMYDEAYSKRFITLIKDHSAAATKPMIEAELVQEKKDWTAAKNGYKKLAIYADSIERVIDSYKQYISTLKEERKYSNHAT